ncbi:MAG: pyrroline-5-carboxylate reductase [Myxococcota bacterium]|jgi:pyrroline-5-carboxylate reductase
MAKWKMVDMHTNFLFYQISFLSKKQILKSTFKMTENNQKILFIGCGKMGSAIIGGLLKHGFEYQNFTILKPSKNNLIVGIKYISSYAELPKDYVADIVVFGFKPQVASEIISDFVTRNFNQKMVDSETIFTSILAGKKTEFFTGILGEDAKILRIMPNLPTFVGEGSFGYFFNQNIKKSEIESLAPFLNGVGKNVALINEDLMNPVTAISGSSPAYLFLFLSSMVEAGIKLGLDQESAEKLAKQAIYGSAKMALESDLNLEDLKKSVASKGGTTQAALDVLQKDDQLKNIVFDAMNAASQRSVELSK